MSNKEIKVITPMSVARQGAVWLFSATYLPAMALSCVFLSRAKLSTAGPAMARGWGRSVTFLAGAKVRYTSAAERAFEHRVARVLTFNHASTLDVPVGAGLLPDGGVLAIKEEMRKIPLLGRTCAALGSVFIDRSNRERAYASLKIGAERIRNEELQVLIAPEGTRSPDGALGSFKLGAFHLAQAADVPILPLVLHGASEIWPRGHLAPVRGTLVIDVLPEFRVADATPETLRNAAEELRRQYMRALDSGPRD